MAPIGRTTSTALLVSYIAALLVKAVHPYRWLPVRRYDMFAAPLTRGNPRSMVVLHLADGTCVAVPPFHLFPFEAPRCTSLLLQARRDPDPAAFAGLMRASLQLHRQGWRAFDQVWGPSGIDVTSVVAACFHRVPRVALDKLATARHDHCPAKVVLRNVGDR